jgi:hypothetical protein
VDAEAQAVFDALVRTLPCEWDGERIVVMHEVVVSSPYGVDDAIGDNEKLVTHVKQVVAFLPRWFGDGFSRQLFERSSCG